VARAEQQLAQAEKASQEAAARSLATESFRVAALDRHREACREVQVWQGRLGESFLDDAFWEREHANRQKISPWLDAAQQRLRDDVFAAAMALHRAFVDAAAKPLRHNLGALMSLFGGRSLPTAEKKALIPDLWSSLFLTVPLISTTFASMERMFRDLPPESLGWLFVDEAGQASPQAAVGAIFRTRRAVVVGDPVQIEPVVTLPERLTHAVCRHFGIDPDRFNAPDASVQSLADAASPVHTEIEGQRLKHPQVPRWHLDNYLLPEFGDRVPADAARLLAKVSKRAPTAANYLPANHADTSRRARRSKRGRRAVSGA